MNPLPKPFEWNPRTEDATQLAIRSAIESAGGIVKVAHQMGVSRSYLEKIRAGHPIDARFARGLVKLCGGSVSLKQVAPAQFGKLTAKELGYTPKPE